MSEETPTNENEETQAQEAAPEENSAEEAATPTVSQEDFDKVRNEFLYLKAEFDNFRKNSIKERSELIKYGPERLLRDLLEVKDNFDRALESEVTAENLDSFKEGVHMTSKELSNVLEKHGLKEEDPQGKEFNPNSHEALSSEESDEVTPGHVLRVFKKAYHLHDKILRPAQVVVAKEKTSEA